jgi:hypothetical protein
MKNFYTLEVKKQLPVTQCDPDYIWKRHRHKIAMKQDYMLRLA